MRERGICNARIHTQGTEIVKRTNEHLHAPDEQAVSCCETKIGIKRRARESQDSSHHIVGESVVTVSEGTAAKLPKLDSLKRTIQRQRVQQMAAPVQACQSGGAGATSRVPADSQGGAVPPHLRDTAQPGDAAAVRVLAG